MLLLRFLLLFVCFFKGRIGLFQSLGREEEECSVQSRARPLSPWCCWAGVAGHDEHPAQAPASMAEVTGGALSLSGHSPAHELEQAPAQQSNFKMK